MSKLIAGKIPKLSIWIIVQTILIIGLYLLAEKLLGEVGVIITFVPTGAFLLVESVRWNELRTTAILQFALAASCVGLAFTAHGNYVGIAFMALGAVISFSTFNPIEKDPSIWNLPVWGKIDER